MKKMNDENLEEVAQEFYADWHEESKTWNVYQDGINGNHVIVDFCYAPRKEDAEKVANTLNQLFEEPSLFNDHSRDNREDYFPEDDFLGLKNRK